MLQTFTAAGSREVAVKLNLIFFKVKVFLDMLPYNFNLYPEVQGSRFL
jgi:hypothetical protein